ncbi:MAG: nucleoside deaminase [Bacteroidales bacterium]|nr:nucleoside deaminase [Bacteroidales bacterium]
MFSDEYFMKQALIEAQKAKEKDEVPVGAVVVADNLIIARAHNLTETLNDVTAHAEMQVITAATNTLGSKYLIDCSMYITLEPCVMCAGALFWAQLSKLVYGANDPKRGYTLNPVPLLHPRTEVIKGILANESEILLKEFFMKKRI